MGRIARVKAKKADRYVPNPHAVVPVDKEGLKLRLERHANLMGELLSEGKDFQSLPISVLKTIVRDFQIAGLAVPTPALQKLQEHQQAGLKNRPSPIFLPPVTDQSRDSDLRSELISRGFNPKTGFSEGAPVLPHQNPGLSRAGFALPYVPVHRYGKTNLFTESANKTSKAWLPPWMMYGDQPNQFVKTPRPQSMGKGPSLNYINNYYQGGRTFGPHMQRAMMSGMQPSVAAQPLFSGPTGRSLAPDPVSRLDEMGKRSLPEPIAALSEEKKNKRARGDKPSRLWTNKYPVNGEKNLPEPMAALPEDSEAMMEPIALPGRYGRRAPDAPMHHAKGTDTEPMEPIKGTKRKKVTIAPISKPDKPSRLWANKYPVYGETNPVPVPSSVEKLLEETGKVSPGRLVRKVASSAATPVAAAAEEEEESANGSPVRRSSRASKPSARWSPSTDEDRVSKGLRESPLAKKAAGMKSTAKPKKSKGAKKASSPSFSDKDWDA